MDVNRQVVYCYIEELIQELSLVQCLFFYILSFIILCMMATT